MRRDGTVRSDRDCARVSVSKSAGAVVRLGKVQAVNTDAEHIQCRSPRVRQSRDLGRRTTAADQPCYTGEAHIAWGKRHRGCGGANAAESDVLRAAAGVVSRNDVA